MIPRAGRLELPLHRYEQLWVSVDLMGNFAVQSKALCVLQTMV